VPDLDGKALVDRYSALKSARSNFDSVWQEIADNLLGARDFLGNQTPGRKRHAIIYDTTGLLSAQMLSAALHALLTNTASRWFGLRLRNTRMMEVPEIRNWLYEAEEEMIAAFDDPEANFSPAMHEGYLDLPTFGNMCIFIGDRPGGSVLFSARPLGEMVVAENVNGKIDTVYRGFDLTAHQVQQQLGEGALAAADKDVKDNKGDTKHPFVHCVEPRQERSYGRLDASGMPWRSTYVNAKTSKIVNEGGYWEMPYPYARWSREAGQTYASFCPGWIALADQKMLNEMSKTMLKGAQKAVDPALLIPNDGVIFPLKTTPGAYTSYDANVFNEDPVRALPQGRLELGYKEIEQRQAMVRKAFHEELLPLFQKPYMTATEVRELANQAQRFLSPTLGRLQVELLQPMIERVFGILMRAGRMPAIPPVLEGEEIQIEYVSPVARAQKESEAQSILDVFAVSAALLPIDPQVGDNLNADRSLREIARLRGAPPIVLNDPREVVRIREARAEQAEKQAAMAEMQAMAQAAGAAAPAVQALQTVQ